MGSNLLDFDHLKNFSNKGFEDLFEFKIDMVLEVRRVFMKGILRR